MQSFLRQHIEKIVKLTDDEAAFIVEHFVEEHFSKNAFLFKQGEHVNRCFFVVKGLLKLLYTDDSGKTHIVSFAMED
ncbi:MAG: cyclic nucleotide-binding domain-containing protein, partial [Flavitalea sp.]